MALADRAIALAPDPELQVTPGHLGLTGLDSFVWIRNPMRPVRATAAAGPTSVTAEAAPAEYVWDFGDGPDRVTFEQGRRWTRRRPGSIAHMYETAGRYELGVDVVWEARWRIGLGVWRHLGYFTSSDSRPYRVREIFPMLIRPGYRPKA